VALIFVQLLDRHDLVCYAQISLPIRKPFAAVLKRILEEVMIACGYHFFQSMSEGPSSVDRLKLLCSMSHSTSILEFRPTLYIFFKKIGYVDLHLSLL
jgi:hypothetical protein